MLFPILVISSMILSVVNQPLAAHVRELTTQTLFSQTGSEQAAIDKEVRDIYTEHGLLPTSQVGDQAAYDFVFLLMGEPRSFQKKVLERLDQPGANLDLPPDAVTFFRTRFRLDGIKKQSQDKPPSDPVLRDEINTLYKSDQAVRQRKGFDSKKLAETDRMHTDRLQTILKEHGVPTYAMVGPEAAGHFVIMIQHQSAQMRDLVLPSLKKDVEAGQADPGAYAMVYDLSQVDKGKKQRFGERLVCRAGELREAPIEDEEHVNQRRAEIGLMRIELYSYLISRMMPQMCSSPLSR